MIFVLKCILFFFFLSDPGNSEETEQYNKLIRRYGVPKSRPLTSSVFMSPISQEHYRLFQPLTGSFHDSVQQAHGLKESRVDCGSDWHTRFVLRMAEGFVMETRGPNLGKVAYPIDGRSCYLTNSPLSAPFLKFNLICKPSIQVIFKTVI